MKKISLFEKLDQVRFELEPLSPHFMTNQAKIERERYITLLLACLIESGGLTESQTRFLDMLLKSIKMECPLYFYLQYVDDLKNEDLLEIFICIKGKETVVNSFIFDLMLLTRIGHSFTDACTKLIETLATILNVSEKRLGILVYWCARVLGGTSIEDQDSYAENVVINRMERAQVGNSPNWVYTCDELSNMNVKANKFIEKQTKIVRENSKNIFREILIPSGFVVEVCARDVDWKNPYWGRYEKNVFARIIKFPAGLNMWKDFVYEQQH